MLKAKALPRQWREIYLSKQLEKQISCRESAFAFNVFQFRLFRLISSDIPPKIGWQGNYDLNVIPLPFLTLLSFVLLLATSGLTARHNHVL